MPTSSSSGSDKLKELDTACRPCDRSHKRQLKSTQPLELTLSTMTSFKYKSLGTQDDLAIKIASYRNLQVDIIPVRRCLLGCEIYRFVLGKNQFVYLCFVFLVFTSVACDSPHLPGLSLILIAIKVICAIYVLINQSHCFSLRELCHFLKHFLDI